MQRPEIFGIVNVTRDSFSDGGSFLTPEAACAHGERLRSAGADVLDRGAESTHPDSEDVAADEELRRLEPVVGAMVEQGATVSVDTTKAAVMRAVLGLGARWLTLPEGIEVPGGYDAPAAEDAALRSGCGLVDRSWTDRLAVVGEEIVERGAQPVRQHQASTSGKRAPFDQIAGASALSASANSTIS